MGLFCLLYAILLLGWTTDATELADVKVKTPCPHGACCTINDTKHDEEFGHNFPCMKPRCIEDDCKFSHIHTHVPDPERPDEVGRAWVPHTKIWRSRTQCPDTEEGKCGCRTMGRLAGKRGKSMAYGPCKKCPWMHQCPEERKPGGRCKKRDCPYDHLRNLAQMQLTQYGGVKNQRKGSCQSHALAAWLTTWIETNEKRVADYMRLKAKGHRLYDTLFRYFSADFEQRGDSWTSDWYRIMLSRFLEGVRTEFMPMDDPLNAEAVHQMLKDGEVLLCWYRMSSERHRAFSMIGSRHYHNYEQKRLGKPEKDMAFKTFCALQSSNEDAMPLRWDGGFGPFTKDAFISYHGKDEGFRRWSTASGAGPELPCHLMLCVPDPTSGGFCIKNSWGCKKADKGFVYIKEETFWNEGRGDSDFCFIRFRVDRGTRINSSLLYRILHEQEEIGCAFLNRTE